VNLILRTPNPEPHIPYPKPQAPSPKPQAKHSDSYTQSQEC